MPGIVTVTLTHGTRRYADLLGRVSNDTRLIAAMWHDAECVPVELDQPGTQWSIVLVDNDPAAWCAATVTDGTLKCHSNYERRAYRGHGHYATAYHERHRTVVAPSSLPALTYLFVQPLALHEADEWQRTGRDGAGQLDGHHWWELRRQDPVLNQRQQDALLLALQNPERADYGTRLGAAMRPNTARALEGRGLAIRSRHEGKIRITKYGIEVALRIALRRRRKNWT